MLIEHILKLTENYRTKKLHATPDGSKVYAPLGFKPCRGISFFAAENPQLEVPAGIGVHLMRPDELGSAIRRDEKCFGFSRRNLLEFNYHEHPELALVTDDNKAHIFGRRWKKYRQMAALAADDLTAAMALAGSAVKLDNSQAQSIITYDSQKDFQSYLQSGGFVKVREMLDMELGESTPEVPEIYRSIYGGDMG